MNILLVCAAGMSTSLLVNRMNEAAAAKGIELHIEAHPVGSIDPVSYTHLRAHET